MKTRIQGKLSFICVCIFIVNLLLIFTSEVKAERFFKKNNTWYGLIDHNNLKLRPESAAHVNDIIINTSILTAISRVNNPQIFYATASTPLTKVISKNCAKDVANCGTGSDANWETWGWNDIPIPAEATPSSLCLAKQLASWPIYPGCDTKVVIVSADRKTAWDMGQAILFPSNWPEERLRNQWVTQFLRKWDLNGDGVNYPYDGKGGPTFAKVPLLHGVVTYDEIIGSSEIDHALAFAYNVCANGPHSLIYPSNVWSAGCPAGRTGALLGGERIFLDKSVNCEAIASSTFERKICTALQNYGAIYMENNGKGYNSIYLECLDDKPESWSGINKSLSNIPLDKLHVHYPISPDADNIAPMPPPAVW